MSHSYHRGQTSILIVYGTPQKDANSVQVFQTQVTYFQVLQDYFFSIENKSLANQEAPDVNYPKS